MDRKISLGFILWTAVISAVPWGVNLLFDPESSALSWALMLLGCAGPAAASFIVTKRNGIVKGFSHWLLTALDPRLPLISWLLPLGLFGVFAVVLLCFGIYPQSNWFAAFCISLAAFGVGELGWRHVLQSLTSLRMNFFLSSAATGILWFLWSLPLAFMNQSWLSGASIAMFVVFYAGAAFTLGAVRRITRAGLPCVLCSTLLGSWVISGAPALSAADSMTLAALVAAVGIPAVVGAVLVYIDKRRPFVPSTNETPIAKKKKTKKRK